MNGQQTADSGQRAKALVRVLLLSAVCCPLSVAFAQEAPPPKDSDLVAAAKKAKEGRVTIPRKVITNSDVKKAKGKLIELPASKAAGPLAAIDAQSSIEKHGQEMKAAAAADKVHVVSAKKVADLEKELAAIEQSYYEENDPTFRDDVIRKKFDSKKVELDAAREAVRK